MVEGLYNSTSSSSRYYIIVYQWNTRRATYGEGVLVPTASFRHSKDGSSWKDVENGIDVTCFNSLIRCIAPERRENKGWL